MGHGVMQVELGGPRADAGEGREGGTYELYQRSRRHQLASAGLKEATQGPCESECLQQQEQQQQGEVQPAPDG